MKNIIIIFFLGVITMSAQIKSTDLTIYNNGFILIKNKVDYQLKKGINNLEFNELTNDFDVASMNILIDSKLLEKSFHNNLYNNDQILNYYLGKNIKLQSKDQTIEGTLINNKSNIIIKTKDNKYVLVDNLSGYNIYLDDLLFDLKGKSNFKFKVESNKDSKQEAEISYIGYNIGWTTEYNAYIDESTKQINLFGWLTISNNSGLDFKDANLKFLAGNVNKTRNQGMYPKEMMSRGYNAATLALDDGSGIEAQEFGDLYKYDYPYSVSIGAGELKQLTLISQDKISYTNKYNFYAFMYQNNEDNIDLIVEFKNNKSNNLGIPLPQGVVKVFKNDNKSYEFVGEDRLRNTANEEMVRLKIGKAFDILGKSEIISTKNISERINEYENEITLKNRKKEPITIEVIAEVGLNTEIISSDESYNKESARIIKFNVKVDSNQEKKFKYKYRIFN